MKQTKKTNLSNKPLPLTHLGLIGISGQDAETFLQGQLTCDIKLATEGFSLRAAYCSPKGRAIASFQVIKESNDSFLLILSEDLTEKVIKRLKMFVMRSKVEITDLTPDTSIEGVSLKQETELSDQLEVPSEPDHVLTGGSSIILRLPGKPCRLIILKKGAKPPTIEENQSPSHNEWIVNDIESGLPLITAAVSEEYIPQMFNLDLLGGIGFKKGCYTGQEIIARMHYLGRLKQRTFLVSTESANLPEAGSPVFDGDQKVGSVLMAAWDKAELSGRSLSSASTKLMPCGCNKDNNRLKMLVVMQISHREGNIHLKNNSSSPLIFEDLPYTFENR